MSGGGFTVVAGLITAALCLLLTVDEHDRKVRFWLVIAAVWAGNAALWARAQAAAS